MAKGLYDSYIRAIRWASDRIGDSGVVAFVTNAGFLDAKTTDGLRRCLSEEFSDLYFFHLRGLRGQKTAGERAKREGGQIFGVASAAAICIFVLVKNPKAHIYGRIHFHDIGDYLNREEKLEKISFFGSVAGIDAAGLWQIITPDRHGDWLNQRDDSFANHIVLGNKKTADLKLFDNFSLGVVTNRDAWCCNASKHALTLNLRGMIDVYNGELIRFDSAFPSLDKNSREGRLGGFINTDAGKISWTRSLKQQMSKGRSLVFDPHCLTPSLYRPFTKQWLYFNRRLNEMVYQMPRVYPDAEAKNLVIQVNAKYDGNGFIALISDLLPDLHCNGDSQCFPLYLYDQCAVIEGTDSPNGELFDAQQGAQPSSASMRRDAITDAGLEHFQANYPDTAITKEDLFYYAYGLLHSLDYRERFADNLGKELPRLARVRRATDFLAFSQAGRKLADIHLNYETVAPYPVKIDTGGTKLTNVDYRVEKMRYGKRGKEKDLTTLHYNAKVTLTGIPLEAYEYVVNGKPALDWVVDRQCVKTDKDSGIVNDANDWAVETMGNPRYPLELFQRVITVSLETMKIVKALPALDI